MSNTTSLPEVQAPLVAPEVDLRSFTFIQFDINWITDGDLAVNASGDGFKAALALMARSWSQIPAGSLPNDDRMLANLAGFGRGPQAVAAWMIVKEEAMSDFVLCTDGRYYSRTLAPKTNEAWASKQAQRSRTEAARSARHAKSRTTHVTSSVTEPVTDAVTESRGDERRGDDRTGEEKKGEGTVRDETIRQDTAREGANPREGFSGRNFTLTADELAATAKAFPHLSDLLNELVTIDESWNLRRGYHRDPYLEKRLRARQSSTRPRPVPASVDECPF